MNAYGNIIQVQRQTGVGLKISTKYLKQRLLFTNYDGFIF